MSTREREGQSPAASRKDDFLEYPFDPVERPDTGPPVDDGSPFPEYDDDEDEIGL